MARVERYGPGEEAKDFVPGDFILSHRHNLDGGLISLAQKRRFKGPDAVYAHWSHTAMITEKDGSLVEAELTGVRQNPISRYRSNEYHLVRLGKEFSDGVVAAGGIDALNRVWTGPDALPTLPELEDPRAWMERTRVPLVTKS